MFWSLIEACPSLYAWVDGPGPASGSFSWFLSCEMVVWIGSGFFLLQFFPWAWTTGAKSGDWGLAIGVRVGISSWSLICGVEVYIGLYLYYLLLCRLSFYNLGKLLSHLMQVCLTIVSQLIYNAYKISLIIVSYILYNTYKKVFFKY